MVFGVFDGLHEGHRHFLERAARLCKELAVVVATDETTVDLKGRMPTQPLAERIEAIQAFDASYVVRPGDEVSGSWNILESEAPDIVFLGYDQQNIEYELRDSGIPYIYMDAYEPDRFKSSRYRERGTTEGQP